jgi:hypothetical protein
MSLLCLLKKNRKKNDWDERVYLACLTYFPQVPLENLRGKPRRKRKECFKFGTLYPNQQ